MKLWPQFASIAHFVLVLNCENFTVLKPEGTHMQIHGDLAKLYKALPNIDC